MRASLSLAVALASTAIIAAPAPAASPDLVISQVYGGGGNTGAVLKNDFIEVFNPTAGPVDVTGWSVQYASATGTSWASTTLSGSVQPGRYLLVREAAGANTLATELPAPDASGSINMSATSGKVRLVTNTTAIRDLVGYGGSATTFEGSGPTATPRHRSRPATRSASPLRCRSSAPAARHPRTSRRLSSARRRSRPCRRAIRCPGRS